MSDAGAMTAVEDYRPLAEAEAAKLCRMAGTWNEFDDLVQAGLVRAWQSLSRYDPAGGLLPQTLVWPQVRYAMLDYLRAAGDRNRHGRRRRARQTPTAPEKFRHVPRADGPTVCPRLALWCDTRDRRRGWGWRLRVVAYLVLVEGLTFDAAARPFGMSGRNVSRLVAAAFPGVSFAPLNNRPRVPHG